MIVATDLRKYVIEPTLKKLGLYSKSAEELLIATCAHESRLGTYLHQIKGPALGIFQIEPESHHDIWINYLSYRPELGEKVASFSSENSFRSNNDVPVYDLELIGNLLYSAAICRIHYLRAPAKLPDHDDLEGLAMYWKQYYNTYKGKGTVDQFIEDYRKYVN